MSALAETPQGFVAIAATLLAYGATELLQGYGFLAVFVAAVVLRGTERTHEFHADLHGVTEQIENLLVVGLLFLFGGALAAGIFAGLTWQGAAVAVLAVLAVLAVFVVRPISELVALIRSKLSPAERVAISFFGIRGFGSVYCLAYDADLGIDHMLGDWRPLSMFFNAVNRAMGKDDLYPFHLVEPVVRKLGFVHEVVRATGSVTPRPILV